MAALTDSSLFDSSFFDSSRLSPIISVFDRSLGHSQGVRLVGGFEEPFYQAPLPGFPGEIRFTRDYANSCLHEVAHWCVAGPERRLRDDFGYWYAPDGRNAKEQTDFFRMEVKPQALEWAFSLACGLSFRISCDNLRGDREAMAEDVAEFSTKVQEQLGRYLERGFPARAVNFLFGLRAEFFPEARAVEMGDKEDAGMAKWLSRRLAEQPLA